MPQARMIEKLCGLPQSSCSDLALLSGLDQKLKLVIEDIEKATNHVHLEYYIYEPDTSGYELSAALIRAAKRGVKVRLLVDDVGSAAFLGKKGKALREELLQAGVELAVFHPSKIDIFARPLVNLRTHRKIIICDAKVGYLGGINITDTENERINPKSAYRDTHMRVRGPILRYLAYVFAEDWVYASGKLDMGAELFPAQSPGKYAAQVVASGPDASLGAIFYSMLSAINQAQSRVWLTTPYFVPPQPALAALEGAALKGLDLRILLPKRSDSFWVSMAASSYFQTLLARGAKIYLYEKMLHAKTLLVDDDYALVGTANFDNRSFFLNFELALVFYEGEIMQELETMFLQDLKHSKECLQESEQASPKSLWQRFAQALARLLSPLL